MKKIHILGSSGNAGRKHMEAIKQLPELYTITDYDDADIIDICTPNWLHVSHTTDALLSGKDCIVEKPFCANLGELETLQHYEMKTGRRVYPILNYRELSICDYNMTWKRSPDYYQGWRGKYDTALGGVILSHGIHMIDHAIYAHGKVSSLECETRSNPVYACEVETEAQISLTFETGRSLSIQLEVSPDKPTKAPPNPGYLDFFKNLDKAPRLSELYHLQEVLDACYAASRSSSIIKLSSAALTA